MSQMTQSHSGKDCNLIKEGFQGRWAHMLKELGQAMGPSRAALAALRLQAKIKHAVFESFKPGKAPMRHMTKREIDRRGQLAVDLCLAYYAAGWTSLRIGDEIEALLLEQLGAKEAAIREKHAWVRGENQ